MAWCYTNSCVRFIIHVAIINHLLQIATQYTVYGLVLFFQTIMIGVQLAKSSRDLNYALQEMDVKVCLA